jgi:hypothetical protein
MKPLKRFHLFFITLSCSLIVTGVVFASESTINQSWHSFPSVELPAETPVIKTVAFTQEHSEDTPLASLARYVIDNGTAEKLPMTLQNDWNLSSDEELLNVFQVVRPTEDPQWSCVVLQVSNSEEYNFIFVENIPEGAIKFVSEIVS